MRIAASLFDRMNNNAGLTPKFLRVLCPRKGTGSLVVRLVVNQCYLGSGNGGVLPSSLASRAAATFSHALACSSSARRSCRIGRPLPAIYGIFGPNILGTRQRSSSGSPMGTILLVAIIGVYIILNMCGAKAGGLGATSSRAAYLVSLERAFPKPELFRRVAAYVRVYSRGQPYFGISEHVFRILQFYA